MACARLTKCVVGMVSIMSCTICGILSRGVEPPESICSGSSTRITSSPSCGIERAIVPIKMPIDVVANRLSATPSINSGIEPSIGTPSTPFTISTSDNPDTTSTTSPIDQIFAIMISNGVIGITSKCSTVPCSRSRISADPVNTIASMVMLLMIAITPPNHAGSRFGLKRIRVSSDTNGSLLSR
ncbi:Uncharacterised protein [Klebsiella pneumoniae]|nr:Uncharacterised protein [Klebsiella pneumoniae]